MLFYCINGNLNIPLWKIKLYFFTDILTQYGVKKISSYAFAECDKVTEVRIGDVVTEIGNSAFAGCVTLKRIHFLGTKAEWNAIHIGENNDALKDVEIICTDGTINASSVDGEMIASGKCGDDLFWYVTKERKLIIVGKGDMNTESPMQLSCGNRTIIPYDILQYYIP